MGSATPAANSSAPFAISGWWPSGKPFSARRPAKVDITKASNPLDLAHERGWMTEASHRAAMTFARIYRVAGIRAPTVRGLDYHEVQEAITVNARSFATMSDAEMTELFDAVFCDDSAPGDREDRSGKALDLWGKINKALSPAEQAELFGVCVMGSWPQWVIYMASGKDIPEAWALRRKRLEDGLRAVRRVLRENSPNRPVAILVESMPEPRGYRGPKIIEALAFVNEEGEPIVPVSERGVPFLVERKVRARC
jgi:hypothetical protein